MNLFPIYARLGVPEIWCYEERELRIYTLRSRQYINVESSLIFPQLPIRDLPQLIESYRLQSRRALRRAVRFGFEKGVKKARSYLAIAGVDKPNPRLFCKNL